MKRIVLIKIENWRVHGDFYCAFNKLDFSVVVFLYPIYILYSIDCWLETRLLNLQKPK